MPGLYLRPTPEQMKLPLLVTSVGIDYHQRPVDKTPNVHHIFFVENGPAYFEVEGKSYIIPTNHIIFAKASVHLTYRAYHEKLFLAFVTFNGSAIHTLIDYFHAPNFFHYDNPALYQKMVTCYNAANRGSSPETLSLVT